MKNPTKKRSLRATATDVEIRCPKLGHQVPFAYCREENNGLPCSKILSCWEPYLPVEKLLRKELSPEEWEMAFERPAKPKLLTLVELIEKARENKRK